MKKIFTLFFIILVSMDLKAQLRAYTSVAVPPFKIKSPTGGSVPACDTMNLAGSAKLQTMNYLIPGKGFIFGTSNSSSEGIKTTEQANYFDLSSSPNNFITGALVYFAEANTSNKDHLKDTISLRLRRDENGAPGGLMGIAFLTLGDVKKDVDNGVLTEFRFTTPIQLPAGKKFYVSVGLRHLHWDADSISVVASGDDDSIGTAYQKFHEIGSGNRKWLPANEIWGTEGNPLDVSLFIFPYLSSSLEGCFVLPVSMFNFGGSINNNQAYLNWSTAAEINNKGFYVERSKDGRDFDDVGFVNGVGNSNRITNYSYTDITLKDINVSTTYYRLKQVDVDGKFSYSKVLALSLQQKGLWKIYPNPVKNAATIELNLESASNVTAQLIAHDGKVLLTTNKGILPEGVQQFYINTQNISQGSYILRLTIGNKTYSQLLIKQ